MESVIRKSWREIAIESFVIVLIVVCGSISLLSVDRGKGSLRPSDGQGVVPLIGEKLSFPETHDIALLRDGKVWAVGYDGLHAEQLFHSRQQGDDLQPVKLDDEESSGLHAIYFPDERHGWAVGDFGKVLRTIDAGVSWQQVRVPTKMELDLVRFESPSVGFVAARSDSGCEVWRTEDAGNSWKLSYGDEESGQVFAIAILDQLTAVMIIDKSLLLETKDGGISWQRITTPITSLSDVTFAPNGNLWLVGDRGGLCFSTDQGATWRSPGLTPEKFSAAAFSSIGFFDDQNIVIVAGQRELLRSNDGGNTWFSNKLPDRLRVWGVRVEGGLGIAFGGKDVYRFLR
jgi:photosystem II stability/assembly factor-like uncharacterized protein